LAQESNNKPSQDGGIKSSKICKQSTTEFMVEYTSNYVWRDYDYDFAAFQPSVTHNFGSSGLSIGIWTSIGASYDTDDIEVIPSISYDFDIKSVCLSMGLLYYTAPVDPSSIGNTNFTELYISSSFTSLLFNPVIEAYYDTNGPLYMSLAAEQKLVTLGKHNLSMFSSVGYRQNSTEGDNGFREFNIGISFPIELKYANLSLFGKLTNLISEDINKIQVGVSVEFH